MPAAVDDTPPAHDATVGSAAGQAGTDGGAAVYHISVVVPPGRAGMQPDISLSYNSRGGNGIAGMGWSVSGTSSIHRCPQTPEQDGYSIGVSYSANDRLCLDGQRLVVSNGAGYGTSGAVYRTEVDSYARITQYGGGLTGNSTCFTVEQREGRIFHYGAIVSGGACQASSANSRVVPGNLSTTAAWMVEKIEDRVGNNELFAYDNSVSNSAFGPGETQLRTITYTGKGTTAGNRVITFNYESRTSVPGVSDMASSYLAGGLTMQTQALKCITTAVGTVSSPDPCDYTRFVRTYKPAYVASSYSGRLHMASIQECASNGSTSACHPATTFNYNDGPLSAQTNTALVNFSALNFQPALDSVDQPYDISAGADFDGDGTREALITVTQSDGKHTYLVQMTGDRSLHNTLDVTGQFTTLAAGAQDLDGSGRAAVLSPSLSTNYLTFGVWNWNLFPRGTPATSNPFQFVASNVPSNFNKAMLGQTTTQFVADMNGDGKPDLVLLQPDSTCGSDTINGTTSNKPGVFVYLNTTVGQISASNPPTFSTPSGPLFCLPRTRVATNGLDEYYTTTIDHIADFNGDGLPDFYLRMAGSAPFPEPNGSFGGIYLTQRSGSSLSVVSAGSVLTCDNATDNTDDECNWQNSYFAQWIDVNGDGLEDFVLARPDMRSDHRSWHVRLNKGGTLSAPILIDDAGDNVSLQVYANPQNGANGAAFRYLGHLSSMDVDSDGKPDILIPSTSQGINGFALKMCLTEKVNADTGGNCPSASGGLINSPQSPNPTGVCAALYCAEDPGTDTVNLPANNRSLDFNPPNQWNNLPAFGTYKVVDGHYSGSPHAASDFSAYHLAMLKFVQTGPSSFAVQVQETPLISRLNSLYAHTQDLFGDGLDDLTTTVGCPNDMVTNGVPTDTGYWSYPHCMVVGSANGTTYGPATLPDGTATSTFATNWVLYANINEGPAAGGGAASRPGSNGPIDATPPGLQLSPASIAVSLGLALPSMPGLLAQATNGLGDAAGWSYAPLSVVASPQDGIRFYTAPTSNGQADSHHLYFQSSMPAVSGMTQSNGVGDIYGFRSAIYGYSQAIYNRLGRGFQGFYQITSETATSSVDASRRLRTTTTFNQKFPLTGKPQTIATTTPSGTLVHEEDDSYLCVASDGGTFTCPTGDSLPVNTVTTTKYYQPVLSTQQVEEYDLGGQGQTSHTNTSNTFDIYGNLTNQIVDRGDDAVGGVFVSLHETTTTNTYATGSSTSGCSDSTANWWINELCSSSVTATIAYGSAHALPTGATAPSQTIATSYTWKADRTPLTRTVQSGVANQQATTTYSYPSLSYGLPSQISVNAPDLATALSPTRSTSFTYTSDGSTQSADGYFVLSTTNGLSQTATTTHETNDGQVLSATGPDNVSTSSTYDPFGRLTQTQFYGNTGASFQPAVNISYTLCNAAGCPGGYGEDGHESNASFRVTTVQSGHPTQVSWHDLLGREIKTAQRAYNGGFNATYSIYDALGTVYEKYAPFTIGSSSLYWTTFSYDALNRTTVKIAPASEMDPTDGDFTTSYLYAGRTTTINAHASKLSCSGSNSNLCITMTRSQNVLGQYMQTQDANGKFTNLWTEPLGHIAAISDPEGNVIKASYNALGQRTSSNDPDQGAWSFNYDALGELLSQTDARSVTTQVTQRDALGRTLQQQQTPASASTTGFSNESVLDVFAYDNGTNGIGQLTSAARRRASGMVPPALTATAMWSETYGFDNAGRPSTISTTINEGSSVAMSTSMSYDTYGRPDTRTYPSGLQVQTKYGAYGHAGAIANAATNQLWWEASTMDNWGKITKELFVDGTVGNLVNYNSTGLESTASWTINSANLDSLTYHYDSFGNLTSQYRSADAGSNTETYLYDKLQRLTSASRTGGAVSYSYTDSGNIASKSDFGSSYSYAASNSHANGCGPHAPYSVLLTLGGTSAYSCDANGNVYAGALSATYDADNHPRTVTRGTGTQTWAYDSHGAMDYELTPAGARYFGPNGYEQTANSKVHELGPIVVTLDNANNVFITTVVRDRLGSALDTVDSGIPDQTKTRSYDPFGGVRNGDMSTRAGGTLNLGDTIHGFTQHDHADAVQLIHMGGRVYDYQLGRFLNVDPIIPSPLHGQGLNPYSYIGNNPLSGIDPTGYIACSAVSASQSNSSGTCNFTNSDGKTVSVGYAFNGDGVVALGRANNMTAVSAAVSVGVLSSNGAEGTSLVGPSSATQRNGEASPSDIGGTGKSIGEKATSLLLPDAHDYVERRKPGGVGDAALGVGIAFWNGVKRTGNALWSDTLMGAGSGTFYPSPFQMTSVPPESMDGAAGGDMLMFVPLLAGKGVISRTARTGGGVATAYRVESAANQRLAIDAAGNVAVLGDNMLFLSFDKARSDSFLARRAEQFGDATLKSFQVPESFVSYLRSNAVLEAEAHMFPNAPLRVDTRYPNQFGLRSEQINSLRDIIIQGSGK